MKKSRSSTKAKLRKPKPIGKVTHFYTDLKVAIVKFNKKVGVGAKVHFRGATTDFLETIKSMQLNHVVVKFAPKGKQVGIKVKKRVREDDLVFLAK